MSDQTTPPQPVTQTHPLIYAGKGLLADLLSTLAFVGLYAATHNVFLAVGCGIALGLGQIAYSKFRAAPIDTMQWLSLFLVVTFGGITMLTRNPVFIMLKPTLIYVAVGTVMLTPGWMNRYMPPIARDRGADITTAFGYVWSALMFATAAANLTLVLLASPAAWSWFIGVFPIASKLALVLTQYGVTRAIIRRRIRAGKLVAIPIA